MFVIQYLSQLIYLYQNHRIYVFSLILKLYLSSFPVFNMLQCWLTSKWYLSKYLLWLQLLFHLLHQSKQTLPKLVFLMFFSVQCLLFHCDSFIILSHCTMWNGVHINLDTIKKSLKISQSLKFANVFRDNEKHAYISWQFF